MILALIALAAIPAQDPPVVTAASAAAFRTLGEAAHREARGKPDRLFVIGQCGDSWNSVGFSWAEPGGREPVFLYNPPVEGEGPTVLDAVKALCDSFEVKLAENQSFDFVWSERDGVARIEIGPITADFGGDFFARHDTRSTAFFAIPSGVE